ncbi:MAG TPA: nitrilase-related carbon-nitrogen hydrolase, partial [Burkholderiaceae bacterium]|nr:nitrilase-related carbon-nitrogen hydrolase [Burkholderiaceae bacterium]
MPNVRVALAQINPTVGDLAGNAKQIAAAAREAHAGGAALMIAPELALSGYPPEDLLLRPAFMDACERELQALALELESLDGLTVLVGHPARSSVVATERTKSVAAPVCFNAASVLRHGRVLAMYCKRELPNYQVFDERRYFVGGREAGMPPVVFEAGGKRFGVLICEDAWFDEPAASSLAAGAQVLCVLNASPFHLDKSGDREARMAERAQIAGVPLLYAHLVGGQDEVVFDGASFAVDALGRVAVRGGTFEPGLVWVELDDRGAPHGQCRDTPSLEQQAWSALVTGVRDYIGKNGFPGVVIGLSGGVDSALVLAIAVDALGPLRVRAVMMPSPYTADIS